VSGRGEPRAVRHTRPLAQTSATAPNSNALLAAVVLRYVNQFLQITNSGTNLFLTVVHEMLAHARAHDAHPPDATPHTHAARAGPHSARV
jgi:hypothetical protein